MTMLTTTNTDTAATPLLLITKDPSHPLAYLALRYARALLLQVAAVDDDSAASSRSTDDKPPLNIFFYADGAHTANRLRWQSAEQINITQEWKTLAERYQLPLPVCVSTALSRGISDADNSARHHLKGDNVASGFQLVGLSDLALMMQDSCRLISF